MRQGIYRLALLGCALAACGGCAAPKVWTAQEAAVIGHMDVCECVAVDRTTGAAYVSNMQSTDHAHWSDDGKAFLSVLRPGGEPVALRWKESTPEIPLSAPKGMCILDGVLYAADVTRVVGFPITPDARVKPLVGPKGVKLNDMASDGAAAYVSDTAAGVVYRMSADGIRRIKAPAGINGITFFKGKMFGVSWDLRDVYELDPTGAAEPKPFGLVGQFQAPDGIEVLDDGTFVVSDMNGNRIVAIDPDRKTVRTLVNIKMPADIGLDRARALLYVPQLEQNQVTILKLLKK